MNREKWFAVRSAITDRENTLDYQDGECPWIAFMQMIDDKAELERRQLLLAAAPELHWCASILYSFARPTRDTTRQARGELREAERFLDRFRAKLTRCARRKS